VLDFEVSGWDGDAGVGEFCGGRRGGEQSCSCGSEGGRGEGSPCKYMGVQGEWQGDWLVGCLEFDVEARCFGDLFVMWVVAFVGGFRLW
jgi:hypothetical protein